MAMKKVNAMLEAIAIGKGKDKRPSVEGYLLDIRHGIGKNKKKKGNSVVRMMDKGEEFEIWGNASILSALCERDSGDNYGPLKYTGCRCKIVFVRVGKAKPGQNAPNICDVFIDELDTLKPAAKGKTYTIKK